MLATGSAFKEWPALLATPASLPALGGPAALGIWMARRFPPGHEAVKKNGGPDGKPDVNGKFYTGLRLKQAGGGELGETSAAGGEAAVAAEGEAAEGEAA